MSDDFEDSALVLVLVLVLVEENGVGVVEVVVWEHLGGTR